MRFDDVYSLKIFSNNRKLKEFIDYVLFYFFLPKLKKKCFHSILIFSYEF